MTHTFNVSHIYDDSYDGDTFDALADALKARPLLHDSKDQVTDFVILEYGSDGKYVATHTF